MPLLQAVFIWMSKVGSFAFFLPVMFCIAIPLGLAREKGVAAFAGFVGYAVMNLAVNFWLTKGILPTTDAAVLKANNIQNIIGIQSIDTGILGAVIAGIIWMLHERFHNIRLPDALAGGTRFVPIITTVVLGLVGLVIPLWPVFAMGINALGHVINSGRFRTDDFRYRRAPAAAFRPAPYSGGADPLYRGGGTMDVCGHTSAAR
jgi:PTS system maltose and glucose-specific IIC component